jgi:hypothetical protein
LFRKHDFGGISDTSSFFSSMVCPLYNRFVAKHRMSGFSKGMSARGILFDRSCVLNLPNPSIADPSKHIRMTEKEVTMRIEDIFR